HDSSQIVRLRRSETSSNNGNAHALLLKQGHSQSAAQDCLKRRMNISHLFLAPPAPQIRMNDISLDGTRSDNGNRHNDVIKPARIQPGQNIHLRPGLYLKDTYRISASQHFVNTWIIHIKTPEIDIDMAMFFDQFQSLLDQGKHA